MAESDQESFASAESDPVSGGRRRTAIPIDLPPPFVEKHLCCSEDTYRLHVHVCNHNVNIPSAFFAVTKV